MFSDPWKIIGWIILFIFIGIPIIKFVIVRFCRTVLWYSQKSLRSTLPTQYGRWVPLWGNKTYYVNDVTESGAYIATHANERGGSFYRKDDWERLVNRFKLIKLD